MTKRAFLAAAFALTLSISMPFAHAADAPVYELRMYTCNEGKLPDLVKRFREHTRQLFEKHGMQNVGYWIPFDQESGAGTTLICVLSHKSRDAAKASFKAFEEDPAWKAVRDASEVNGKILAKPPESIFMAMTDFSPPLKLGAGDNARVFEMRTYTTPEGKLTALHDRFRNYTMKLFEKYGMTNVFYFNPTDADQGAGTKLIYWLAHSSKDAGRKSFTQFRVDPDWVKAKAESEKDGSLTIMPQTEGVKSVYMEATDFSPIR